MSYRLRTLGAARHRRDRWRASSGQSPARAAVRRLAALAAVALLLTPSFAEVPQVESNVIFGMYSGLALLMDVHRPEKANGYGIVYISGSGWHAPLGYDASPLKESSQVAIYAKPLVEAGYTVFAVNHRAASRFRYPAALEDVQRAVRFVRHHAGKFGIDAERIGGTGGSSGGHLISLLGVLDGKGDPSDPDPVNRQSAKLQCVVARAAPSDLSRMKGDFPSATVASFLGVRLPPRPAPNSLEMRVFREASPLHHVSADDPPFLLLHGDADETVLFEQAEWMHEALQAAGIPVRLLRIPGGGHGAVFRGAQNPPDYIAEMIAWFERHLRQPR